MPQSPASSRCPVYIYIPYVDHLATGLQRFGSQMIPALLRERPDAHVLIGHLEATPPWLRGIPHRVILNKHLDRLLPRSMLQLFRLLWLQFVLPFLAGRKGILLALGHELAPMPLTRQIAVAHDLTDRKSYAEPRSFLWRIRSSLWTMGLKRSNAVIAISQATKDDLIATLRLPGDGIVVVHEAFDPDVFRGAATRNEPDQRFLLYAGTLATNKNVEFLVDVYGQLRKHHDILLKLVGKQDPARVSALLSRIPIALRQDLQFEGFVDDARLALLMQQCTGFVFPSLNEGFGLAIVEAMACGAPIVSSDAGSLREVVGRGGILLSPHDQGAWVEELSRLLSDDLYRAELAQRATARSTHYSWARAAVEYQAVLSNVAC